MRKVWSKLLSLLWLWLKIFLWNRWGKKMTKKGFARIIFLSYSFSPVKTGFGRWFFILFWSGSFQNITPLPNSVIVFLIFYFLSTMALKCNKQERKDFRLEWQNRSPELLFSLASQGFHTFFSMHALQLYLL